MATLAGKSVLMLGTGHSSRLRVLKLHICLLDTSIFLLLDRDPGSIRHLQHLSSRLRGLSEAAEGVYMTGQATACDTCRQILPALGLSHLDGSQWALYIFVPGVLKVKLKKPSR